MPFYLSEYIGSGTHADPFRPVGADQPNSAAIDLRPDGGATLGGGGLNACLLWTNSTFSDPRARFLADDKLESLTNQQKNFLRNKLGVDLSSPTLLRDIIATLMTKPPTNGWKGIRPTPLQWEVWLGELIWSAPYISGGASDDFNRADGDIATGVPAWEKRSSGGFSDTVSIVSNVASSSDAIYRYVGAALTDDQYAQLTRGPVTSNQGGPAVRVPPAGAGDQTLCYTYDSFFGQAVYKVVSESFTSLGAIASSAPTPGDTIYVSALGSSIDLYIRGTHDANYPKTDTAVTTGQPGFFNYETFDDWFGGDLFAVTQGISRLRGLPRKLHGDAAFLLSPTGIIPTGFQRSRNPKPILRAPVRRR